MNCCFLLLLVSWWCQYILFRVRRATCFLARLHRAHRLKDLFSSTPPTQHLSPHLSHSTLPTLTTLPCRPHTPPATTSTCNHRGRWLIKSLQLAVRSSWRKQTQCLLLLIAVTGDVLLTSNSLQRLTRPASCTGNPPGGGKGRMQE